MDTSARRLPRRSLGRCDHAACASTASPGASARCIALEDADAARARRARSSPSSGPSGCGKSTLLELVCGLQAPDAGTVRGRPRGADAPARPAAAVAERARQRRAARCACAAPSRAAGARAGPPAVRALGLDGLRARAARRAVGRDAPARRVRAHAAGRASRCCASTSRSGRSTRSRAREMQAGWPDALAREPRTVVLVTHDVEEAVRARRPRRRAVAAPRARAWPSCRSALPRPRRAHRRRRGRAARARAGRAGGRRREGAPILLPALLLARACSAPGSSTRGSAPSTPSSSPRPTEIAARCGTTAGCCGTTSRVTGRGGAARHRSSRSSPASRCAIAHAPVGARCAARVYPLLVASQTRADRDHRAAARRLVRLRHRAQARDHRARSASSRSSSRRSTRSAARRPRAGQAHAHARRLALAGLPLRRGAGGAAGRCCRGAKIAVAVAVIGAVLRRAGGLERRPRPPAAAGASPSSRPPRAYAAVVLLSAFAVALFCALDAGRAAGSCLGPPTEPEEPP